MPLYHGQTCSYFIEGIGTGLVKIGRTTSLASRFHSLQYGSPTPLRLLGATHIPEARLHKRFASVRQHGEWFTFTDEIRNFIQANCSIPDWFYSPRIVPDTGLPRLNSDQHRWLSAILDLAKRGRISELTDYHLIMRRVSYGYSLPETAREFVPSWNRISQHLIHLGYQVERRYARSGLPAAFRVYRERAAITAA